MRRVSARLELEIAEPAHLVLAVAVARGTWTLTESLVVSRDGVAQSVTEVAGPHGTRLHQVAPDRGTLVVDYRATVTGRDLPTPPTDHPHDLITYLRPSRYAESDAMVGMARAELGAFVGPELPEALARWVGDHLDYVPGSTRGSDGARGVLLSGQGVCRDYAHVCVALARALDVPARLAAVYAPGLSPMDFHAVAELWVNGAWRVADATRLAPRASMLRIATGRDAADTAFLSTYGGVATLLSQEVTAVVDGDLPPEDWSAPATLG